MRWYVPNSENMHVLIIRKGTVATHVSTVPIIIKTLRDCCF